MKTHVRDTHYVSERRIWSEVLLFTAIALILPLLVKHQDPFFYSSTFCWPMFAPILVALRYGFAKGLSCVLILIVLQNVVIRLGSIPSATPFPYESVIGYILLIMVCGEFRSWWGRTNEQQRYQLDYVQDRFETFTRHYHLLRTSHDRLEQTLASHHMSLRESLQAVKTTISQLEDRNLRHAATPILNLFVEYGNIQTAAFYAVTNDTLVRSPLASVGPVKRLPVSDPLIDCMFDNQQLVSFRQLNGVNTERSPYQVAIPLIDVNQTVYAAILVEQIQFFSLTKETMTLLAVIAGHIGDLLRNAIANPIMGPDDIINFQAQIHRASKEGKRHHVPAQVLKLKAAENTEKTLKVLDYLKATRRGLDVYLYDDRDASLILLLPLSGELDLTGFLTRINNWAQTTLGESLSHMGIDVVCRMSLPQNTANIDALFDNTQTH